MPNRVRVRLGPGRPGYLVLTDVWFPGWQGSVDGQAAHVYRADYVFRAVAVSEQAREVVFTFEPESYRRGRLISGAALALVVGVSIAGLVRPSHRSTAGVS